VLAVRLQEMFGATESPHIYNGKVPLLIHLLSPARRPVQVTADDPTRGDLVTHRIVGVDESGSYITKGDANGVNDAQAVPPRNVKGVGKWVVPYVGLPAVWVASGDWLPLALTVIATVWVMWFVRYALESKYDPWLTEESESPVDPAEIQQ
ncbi:MAG: ATP-dependent helicase C-terminal domain-containing protein, partial [Actinomycetota bacterium]|nr:ATP-dependent helicase C-terminal domain-containing protein [Actinomycetota bacterium]